MAGLDDIKWSDLDEAQATRIHDIRATADGETWAIRKWLKDFDGFIKSQCDRMRIPKDEELTSAVMVAVWKASTRYKFTEKNGWGNTWISYLRRSIFNAINDVGNARARRKESVSDVVPEQEAPDFAPDSAGYVLALQWQEYALELTDLECDQYARVRRRGHSGQLFEDYDGQFSAQFLANDGFTLIRFFETDERPTWPRFAKAHRLSRQGVEMLMFHLRQALDSVPLDVP